VGGGREAIDQQLKRTVDLAVLDQVIVVER
jgi:hypothetical protein